MYYSTKIFDNYSVAIRQWRAQHSHCQLLHGYGIYFHVTFGSNEPDIDKQLDDMNWIVDFGGFKSQPVGNGLKDWMNHMFDHTTLIEKKDPFLDLFQQMEQMGLLHLRVMDKMGCESLARLVFDKFNDVLSKTDAGRCKVVRVECFEHAKNSAIFTTQLFK
jgi:6-pyruvoyltetrahydropterin/6-carboxytetrahydropterin synthase